MDTRKSINKSVKICIVALLLLGVFSFRYCSFEVDKTFDCISYRLGEDTYENTVVRIVGKTNKSLILQNYFSYAIYIDGVRYPKENDILFAYKNRTNWKVTGEGDNRKYKFKPINVIETPYHLSNSPNFPNHIYIEYQYWNEDLPYGKSKHFSFGVLNFSDENFDDIIIGISEKDETGSSWTNAIGNKVIVSGHDMKSAELTFEKLKLKVFDEEGNVIE